MSLKKLAIIGLSSLVLLNAQATTCEAPKTSEAVKSEVKAITQMLENVADPDNPLFESFQKTLGNLVLGLRDVSEGKTDTKLLKQDTEKLVSKMTVYSQAFKEGFTDEEVPRILDAAKEVTQANIEASKQAKQAANLKKEEPKC